MKTIVRLTPERIQAMIAEEKINHPSWGRDEIRDSVIQKLRQSHIFTKSVGPSGLGRGFVIGVCDPGTLWAIANAFVFVGKLGWFGWKVYKGDTEIPCDVEEWIDAALDLL